MADNRHEELEKRMLQFAVGVIKNLQKYPTLSQSVANQLTRSATSIGANYAEACNAASRADFKNKIYISKKEAAESRYWIDLCIELTDKESWQELRQEAHELLVILQSVVNTMNGSSAK